MLFPEQLYQLSQRDQQVTWLDPTLTPATAGTSAASAGINHNIFTVPTGLVFIMQFASTRTTNGAGQGTTSLFLDLLAPGGASAIEFAGEFFTAVANLRRNKDWTGSLAVPPGWRVRGSATFDSGVNANVVTGTCGGILIPVGNIQRL